METKRRWKTLGLMAVAAGLATAARANLSDSLTVTIQPNGVYSVLVTTTPAGYLNLGLVNLSASDFSALHFLRVVQGARIFCFVLLF